MSASDRAAAGISVFPLDYGLIGIPPSPPAADSASAYYSGGDRGYGKVNEGDPPSAFEWENSPHVFPRKAYCAIAAWAVSHRYPNSQRCP